MKLFQDKRVSLIFCGLTFLSACAWDYPEDAKRLRLNFNYQRSSGHLRDIMNTLLVTPPAASTNFTCFAANIVGAGIPASHSFFSNLNTSEFNTGTSNYCHYLGATSPIISTTQTNINIDVMVPPGADRRIQILGLGSNSCPDGGRFETHLADSITATFAGTAPTLTGAWVLGEMSADLRSNQAVNMPNSYVAATPKDLFNCDSYAAMILSTPGISAYWRFNETDLDTASTILYDAKGGFGTGVVSGTLTDQQVGIPGSLGFSASSSAAADRVDFTQNKTFSVTTGFSIEFWARPEAANCTTSLGFLKFLGAGGPPAVIKFNCSGSAPSFLSLVANKGSGTDVSVMDNTTSSYTPNAWHHVVGTYDPADDTLRLYVNGALNKATPAAGNLNADISITSATFFTVSGDSATGRLDEVAVYDVPLSLTEIARHHCAGNPQGANCN